MIEQWYPIDPHLKGLYLFFGRRDEIAWVTEQVARGQRLLAVYGSHRIGKTCLLHALIDRLSREYLPVYLDADKAAGWESASPLLQIAGEVGRKVREQSGARVDPPEAAFFAEDPLGAWQAYVGGLDVQLERQQLVFLVDNVECVAAEWLHILLQSPVPMLVTAESHRRLSEGMPGTTFAPPSVTLGPLDNDAAEDLVKALITPKSPIDLWAVRRLLEVATNQPYYIHLICRVLLECCAFKTPITPPQVEDALQAILDMPVAEFIVEWQSSTPREQVILAVFSALRGHGGIATQYDLQKAFARYGQYPLLKDIVFALDSLVQRDVLERMGTNTYRFQLELLRLWIGHRHTPEKLLRMRQWRSQRSFLDTWLGKLRRLFAQRRTLWLSLAAVAFVVLIVGVQPQMWRGRTSSTSTPVPTTTVERTTQPTSPTPVIRVTPAPTQATTVLPDYDLLLMSRTDRQDPWQIYALNSGTGERMRLMTTGSNERTPRWSPDGRHIAFASDRDGDRDIYVMDLQAFLDKGGAYQPLQLTQNKNPDWQPAWSPDGTRIAFSSYLDDNWEIYVIDADGTDLARLTEHPENDISPTWSPDGTKLLFVSRRFGDADLFAHDMDTGALTQLTTGELDEYDPAWSPDGNWIAFVTQIGNQSDLFVMRADGSDPVNLTNSSYANDFQPLWTANSEQVIFVSYTAAQGEHDLYIMQRDGSHVTALADDDNDDIAPSMRYFQ